MVIRTGNIYLQFPGIRQFRPAAANRILSKKINNFEDIWQGQI